MANASLIPIVLVGGAAALFLVKRKKIRSQVRAQIQRIKRERTTILSPILLSVRKTSLSRTSLSRTRLSKTRLSKTRLSKTRLSKKKKKREDWMSLLSKKRFRITQRSLGEPRFCKRSNGGQTLQHCKERSAFWVTLRI